VIGWLFLLQVIAAFGLGLAVLATGGRLVIARRLAAAGGAGFALATLGGYLLSVWTGLFGFNEVDLIAPKGRRQSEHCAARSHLNGGNAPAVQND
jgi:hypothetical protein